MAAATNTTNIINSKAVTKPRPILERLFQNEPMLLTAPPMTGTLDHPFKLPLFDGEGAGVRMEGEGEGFSLVPPPPGGE